MKMIGHVTSSYWSENCGRSIALALVDGGATRMGETLYVPMPDGVDRSGGDRHGVLRREGRAPQWLRLPRRHPPADRRAMPRFAGREALGRRRTLVRAAAGRAHFAARAGRVGRGAVQGARRRPAAEAEDLGDNGRRARRCGSGPDEWLVIDEAGKDPLADCAAVKELHSAVGISHRNVAHLGRRAGCGGDAQCRLPAGPVARRLSGRRLLAHHPRQGRDRAAAHRRRQHSASNAGARFRLCLHLPDRGGEGRGSVGRSARGLCVPAARRSRGKMTADEQGNRDRGERIRKIRAIPPSGHASRPDDRPTIPRRSGRARRRPRGFLPRQRPADRFDQRVAAQADDVPAISLGTVRTGLEPARPRPISMLTASDTLLRSIATSVRKL